MVARPRPPLPRQPETRAPGRGTLRDDSSPGTPASAGHLRQAWTVGAGPILGAGLGAGVGAGVGASLGAACRRPTEHTPPTPRGRCPVGQVTLRSLQRTRPAGGPV